MSQLVPCPSCSRHVRLTEAGCPFCGNPLAVAALSERYAARAVPVPGGLKRAALFALGTSVAAACGGRTAGESQGIEPIPTLEPSASVTAIYGAPTAPPSPTSVTNAPSPTTIPPMTPTNPGIEVPIYGAPIPTDPLPTTTPIITVPTSTGPTMAPPPTTSTSEVTWGSETTVAPESSVWVDPTDVETVTLDSSSGTLSTGDEVSTSAPGSTTSEVPATDATSAPDDEDTAVYDGGLPDGSL